MKNKKSSKFKSASRTEKRKALRSKGPNSYKDLVKTESFLEPHMPEILALDKQVKEEKEFLGEIHPNTQIQLDELKKKLIKAKQEMK